MSIRTYAGAVQTRSTPQSEPVAGQNMIQNEAGGYVFEADIWTQLDRFLILGSEDGTYYTGARELTVKSAKAITACIAEDGVRTVNRIVEISNNGRAVKNDPAILALGLALKSSNAEARRLARFAVPVVCRTATHLFALAEVVEAVGGWGRGTRSAFGDWYALKLPEQLSYQLVKYRQRNGWTHRDILRLAHPKKIGASLSPLMDFATKGSTTMPIYREPEQSPYRLVEGYAKAQASTEAKEVAGLIREYRLPREAVPTQHLNSTEVWDALLDDMPFTALIRNLGNLSKHGLIDPTNGGRTQYVLDRLADTEGLRKSRVHPMAIFTAALTYAQGHGLRGRGEWSPNARVVDALDAAFYAAFGNVTPTGKRIMVAIDESGSMGHGNTLKLAAAMAAVYANVEPNVMFTAFTYEGYSYYGRTTRNIDKPIRPVAISAKQRVDDIVRGFAAGGGTDISLPYRYALKEKLELDAFIVITDNETWFGDQHPFQAVDDYRRAMGPAKSVYMAMTATDSQLSRPDDAGSLEVVGFDAEVPQVISGFLS